MDPINDRPGVLIASAKEVMAMEQAKIDEELSLELELNDERIQSSLSSHIHSILANNKEAKSASGINDVIMQSLRAYNGNYDPEELAKIKEFSGSEIFMNLTSTKCRAAMSWIRDIMMPANDNAFMLEPSPVPDVPERAKAIIQQHIDNFMNLPDEESQESAPADQTALAAKRIKDTNRLALDLEEVFMDEVFKLALREIKKYEREIVDQLAEGGWTKALSEFIEDFCIFPVAIMKGPIITPKKRLKWVNGRPEATDDFIYMNKRVSPLDIFPSAKAEDIQDGDLCEVIEFSRHELYSLIGVKNYNEEAIREVLQNKDMQVMDLLYDETDEEREEEEYKESDIFTKADHSYEGIHFWGSAPWDLLVEYGIPEELLGSDPDAEFQIEAILVGTKVIKCVLNDDPLLRRPYYKASFQNIPGSWYGRSLPELMRDDQRMCNGAARALANNMGIASGPIIEVYEERLASDDELEELHPFQIIQVKGDPTGGSGRAVQFYQPTSNVGELMSAYKEFEIRADDATGIPRYAYGNENVSGAAQTASGMSMLLESASKGIKDAIRHIDEGLIKPRVEYQFYLNMLTNEQSKFSGDVVVIPRGSQALTMRGAQEMRRNEFLQILANPTYLGIVGVEGVAEILREMAKSLGLGESIIPSRIELQHKVKADERKAQKAAEQQAKIEQQKNMIGLQTTQMQTQQADVANQRNASLKAQEIELKKFIEEGKQKLKAIELEQRREAEATRSRTSLIKQQMGDAQKDRTTNKNVALSIKSGFQDKNNEQ